MHSDHLGGTNVVSDQNGLAAEVTDYYPYGTQRVSETFDATPEQRKFSGLEFDSESDLTYANARYYDQDVGRFLSQDPVFINLGVDERTQAALANPQLQHAYSYGANNPVKNTDKEGEFLDTIADIGFILYDSYRLTEAVLTGGDVKTEAAALGADVIGAFVPFGTGFGFGVRAVKAADNAADAAKATTQTLKGAQNPATQSALKYGQEQHKLYNPGVLDGNNYLLNREIPGTQLRPDAIDLQNKVIRELKPDNARAIERGNLQLQKYIDSANKAFGGEFKGVIDTYKRPD